MSKRELEYALERLQALETQCAVVQSRVDFAWDRIKLIEKLQDAQARELWSRENPAEPPVGTLVKVRHLPTNLWTFYSRRHTVSRECWYECAGKPDLVPRSWLWIISQPYEVVHQP